MPHSPVLFDVSLLTSYKLLIRQRTHVGSRLDDNGVPSFSGPVGPTCTSPDQSDSSKILHPVKEWLQSEHQPEHISMTTKPIPDFHLNRPTSRPKVVVTRNLGPDVMPLLLQRQDLEASSVFGNSKYF